MCECHTLKVFLLKCLHFSIFSNRPTLNSNIQQQHQGQGTPQVPVGGDRNGLSSPGGGEGGVAEGVSGNGVAAVGGNGATAAAAAAAAAARNTRFMMEGVGAR